MSKPKTKESDEVLIDRQPFKAKHLIRRCGATFPSRGRLWEASPRGEAVDEGD
jgi:hypothetical protein